MSAMATAQTIRYGLYKEKERAYIRDGEPSPHHGQDAVNVVGHESIGIFGAVEVSDPETR